MKVQVIRVSYVITAFDSDKLQVGDVLTSNDGWLKISEPPESMKDYFTPYPLPRGSSFEYYTPDGVASLKVGQVWDVNRPKSEEVKYVDSISWDVNDEAPLDKVKPYMEKFNRKMGKIKDMEPKEVARAQSNDGYLLIKVKEGSFVIPPQFVHEVPVDLINKILTEASKRKPI